MAPTPCVFELSKDDQTAQVRDSRRIHPTSRDSTSYRTLDGQGKTHSLSQQQISRVFPSWSTDFLRHLGRWRYPGNKDERKVYRPSYQQHANRPLLYSLSARDRPKISDNGLLTATAHRATLGDLTVHPVGFHREPIKHDPTYQASTINYMVRYGGTGKANPLDG